MELTAKTVLADSSKGMVFEGAAALYDDQSCGLEAWVELYDSAGGVA